MGLSLSAEQKRLTELFAKTNTYLIPSYQRPYSWSEKECLDLWDDLIFIFNHEDSEEYFLGNIVLAKSAKNDVVEVIDGQQRLITLTLFLKVLSLFDGENAYLEEAIWNKDRRDKSKKTPRLRTMVFEDGDNENFEKVLVYTEEEIININIKKSNLFEQNLKFFYDKLNDNEEIEKSKIADFSDFLLERVYILPIQSEDIDEEKAREKALIIFETINNRGLDLSDADIFKAQLYNSASNKKESEEFIERWKDLVSLAKNNDYSLVDVFRIYSHVLRGKNGDKGNEIGLRAFFAQDKKGYISLRKRDYNEILDDLNKILLIIELFNKCIKNEWKVDEEFYSLSKWFQVIDEYTNNYPKYIVFIYLFINSSINKEDNLTLGKEKMKELLLLSQNIIKYVYQYTSAMKIRFVIFEMIVKVAKSEFIDFSKLVEKKNKNTVAEFGSRDGRKKGFSLLSLYLNREQEVVYPYYFNKLISSITIKNRLNNTWEKADYEIYSNSIGNLLVTDDKRKNQVLIQRIEPYSKSKIKDLEKLSTQLSNFNYEDFKEREDDKIDRLVSFFSKDTLW
ncbi:MAG: Unknown protein [uncultured Sulfurovum sp.]|uniref:GmrSD restriction endonucleases N-terminal domain-containing protein n=1 Tax=uncultured Sulfurovum sp. TaxID=269237 RepID=A0A6S6U8J3_9BACT|nr:MAG: Unknown protein [uncultured Sulfurovum sp.]